MKFKKVKQEFIRKMKARKIQVFMIESVWVFDNAKKNTLQNNKNRFNNLSKIKFLSLLQMRFKSINFI